MQPIKAGLKVLIFHLSWLTCASLGNSSWEIGLLVFPLGVLFAWSRKMTKHQMTKRTLPFFLALTFFGIFADLSFQFLGLVEFSSLYPSYSPLWLIAIWFLFTWISPVIWSGFQGRSWVLAALSMIAGPLNYWFGENFGLVRLHGPPAFIAYAVFWAAFLPLGQYLYFHFKLEEI